MFSFSFHISIPYHSHGRFCCWNLKSIGYFVCSNALIHINCYNVTWMESRKKITQQKAEKIGRKIKKLLNDTESSIWEKKNINKRQKTWNVERGGINCYAKLHIISWNSIFCFIILYNSWMVKTFNNISPVAAQHSIFFSIFFLFLHQNHTLWYLTYMLWMFIVMSDYFKWNLMVACLVRPL